MGQLLIPGSEGERAAAGAFLNRLKLSEALLLALAAVGAWLSAGVGVRLRWLGWVGLPVFSLVLAMTFSKAAWLGALACAAVGFVLIRRLLAPRWVIGALFAGSTVALVVAVYAGASLSNWDELPGVDSWNIRRWIWMHALAVWADHPWFGCGMGTYAQVAPTYFNPDVFNWVHGSTAHQHYLMTFVEGGVAGGLLWTGLMWKIGRMMCAVWQTSLSPRAQALRSCATMLLVGLWYLAVFTRFSIILRWAYMSGERSERSVGFRKMSPCGSPRHRVELLG